MNIAQAVIEALQSLASNKLRSALTILGIVIGVGAVIAMLAVGSGAQQAITGSISGIGTNLLFVVPKRVDEADPPRARRTGRLHDPLHFHRDRGEPGAVQEPAL